MSQQLSDDIRKTIERDLANLAGEYSMRPDVLSREVADVLTTLRIAIHEGDLVCVAAQPQVQRFDDGTVKTGIVNAKRILAHRLHRVANDLGASALDVL